MNNINSETIKTLIDNTISYGSNLSENVKSIKGMTNLNVRNLINNICNLGLDNYLEIGTYLGSSFCSAISNTNLKSAYCVDFYSYFDKINQSNLGQLNKSKLIENINNTPHNCEIYIIDYNVYDLDFSIIKEKIKIIFYDGPHETENCVKILENIYPILDNEFILVVDDYSHEEQKLGIDKFMKIKNIKCNYAEYLPKNDSNLDENNNSGFYNGILVSLCQK